MKTRRRDSFNLLFLLLCLSILQPNIVLGKREARSSRHLNKHTPQTFKHKRNSVTNLPYCVYRPPLAPIFLPPVIYPPPLVPPPPPRHEGTLPGLWCVAKPTVPDPIIQEAMDYACGAGADCGAIQPGGSCYQPDTLIAHASFAFNSYWQRTKVAGGTCYFDGTAMLITTDPSYGGCYFNMY